jgi:hypothetical protein
LAGVTCAAVVGSATPDGTKKKLTPVQDVPVLCPSVTCNVPLVQTGELHKNPELAMQVVPVKELLLKIPSEKSAASTIAIISIAQPYVIRYSIALCAFWFFIPMY